MQTAQSINQQRFILSLLKENKRLDARKLLEYRKMNVNFLSDYGSIDLCVGKTRVLASVVAEPVQPYSDRPTEGILNFSTKICSFVSSTSNDASTLTDLESLTNMMIDRLLKSSRAVDTEGLCIVAGKLVWCITVTINVLVHDGNIIESACLAAIISLLHFRRPDVTVLGGNQEVIVHPVDERHPIPLSIHHIPICVNFSFMSDELFVVDPTADEETIQLGSVIVCMNSQRELCALTKAGGCAVSIDMISQCCEVAFVRANELTTKIVDLVKQDLSKRKTIVVDK